MSGTTFFTDMKNAVEEYPSTGMDITIEDLEQLDNPNGQDVNIDEVWRFKVKVRNRGWLGVDDLQVRVEAQNGAKVSLAPDGRWKNSVRSNAMSIASGRSSKTDELYFRAPGTAGPAELLRATVAAWDADPDAMLATYSTATDEPAAVFSTNVVGD